MKIKLFTGLIFLIPVLIFVVQNSTPVVIRFVKWEYSVSLALLTLSSVLIGVILGILFGYFRRARNNKKQKKAEQEAAQRQPLQKGEPSITEATVERTEEPLEATEKLDIRPDQGENRPV